MPGVFREQEESSWRGGYSEQNVTGLGRNFTGHCNDFRHRGASTGF